MLQLVSLGKWFLSTIGEPISRIALWEAKGSHYWRGKWLGSERKYTIKRNMLTYLHESECTWLCFLQKELGSTSYEQRKYSKAWEYYRLLAVMEAANNGSPFERELLLDGINSLLAFKFSADKHISSFLLQLENAVASITSRLLQEQPEKTIESGEKKICQLK